VAERYVGDHYDRVTNNFLIKSYSNSDTYSFTLAFFEVFEVGFLLQHRVTVLICRITCELQLVGTINAGETRSISVQLFVRVPILGRVEIVTVAGQLTRENKLSTAIDCPIAKGTVSLFLRSRVLYADIDVTIRILGHFREDNINLLTLP
jgi:hypothetical protein